MAIDDILQGLNDEQKEAVKHLNGPALVIATAGSGNSNIF